MIAPAMIAPATIAPGMIATGLLMGGMTATGIETSIRGIPEITVTATVVLKAAVEVEVVEAATVIMAGIVTMADVEAEAEAEVVVAVANVVGSKARLRSRPTLSFTRVTLRSRRRASASFVLPRPILHRSRATSS